MASEATFAGFSPEALQFFKELTENNSKAWFEEHRSHFNNYVFEPVQQFVVAMGEQLEQIAPDIHAIPKTDKTIFRLHRDVRFSPDKSPYKTHQGMLFWDGERKKMENPGFYVHFTADTLLVAGGYHQFPKEHLKEYRDSVVHPQHGPALVKAIEEITTKNTFYRLGKPFYKKVPRGFDAEHPQAELLKYNGIGFQYEMDIPGEFFSEKLVDFVYGYFEKLLPIHQWLKNLNERVSV